MFPEGPAAADLVFPEARLRFVNAQRDGAAQGKAELGGVESLVVDAVARLVEDAKEALVEFARLVAGGEPAIARTDAAAKRVSSDVEAAGAEVESDRRRRRLPKKLLAVHGVVARQDVRARLRARGGDVGHERRQLLAQRGEHRCVLTRRRARLGFIQQGVVRRILIADRLRFFTLEPDDLLEPGREAREIAVAPGFLPDVLRPRHDAG